jgi:hypothetical protein
MELNKASLPYAKLMHHNPEKWKMKFKMLFEREKIISFSGEVSINLNITVRICKTRHRSHLS